MSSPCSNLSIVALSFVLPLVNPFLQWVAAKAKMNPEKSSVCGLFLAFFKLPTRDKIFSSKFHTTFPNLLQQQKQEKKKPTTKNKTKKNLTKHPNTVQPPSPLPFLLLQIYYHPTTKPKTRSWCFLTTTTTTKNLSLMLPNNNNKDTNWWIQFPVMLMILQSSTKPKFTTQHKTKFDDARSLSLSNLSFFQGLKLFFLGFP